jgi:hypothetical protein
VDPNLELRGEVISHPESYLRAYRQCWYYAIGAEYLDADGGEPDQISIADVATSLLMNSQATAFTVRTVAQQGPSWSELLRGCRGMSPSAITRPSARRGGAGGASSEPPIRSPR